MTTVKGNIHKRYVFDDAKLTVMFLIIMLLFCFLCIGQNKSRGLIN